ncbi:uncharacterized protein C20orf204 homolog isoform X2 [Pleurodeles waltl]|uniref:uncharacterized protein C20orf204 homolog isoform X2 n=1 Tax=Pleurodeles waltl TaxID=8319 RepID=UPI0037098D2E
MERQTLPRVFLRAIMLGMLVVSMLSEKKKGCNISRILQHYKEVVYEELQYLKNLTGAVKSRGQSRRERISQPCWAQKELRILHSIKSLSSTLACEVTGTGPPRLESAVQQVATSLDSLLFHNCQRTEQPHRKEKTSGCKTSDKESSASMAATYSRRKSRKRQQRRVAQIVENITDCWEKLFFLYCTDCKKQSS